MSPPVLFESHCHTPLCGHAVGKPKEYARVALERGLAGINFTCHGPNPNGWSHCMKPDEWPKYIAMTEEARLAYEGRLEVKAGVECDFLPSLVDYWREWLPQHELSHVLGSVHPQVADYRALFWTGDALSYQKTYFKHLADAAETGLFDTLSHPDLVKNTTPPDWDVRRLMPHICRQLDRIQKTGVAMELNTSGTLKRIPEMNPAPAILQEIAARDIPIVLGADAHTPDRVADRFEEALGLLASCGFSHVSFFVDRKRREVSIETARCSLKDNQAAPSK